MVKEFLETFILVFVAEMGDKTQLLLMTLAAKYSVIQVLAGIFLGVLINHGSAVFIGCLISNITDEYILQLFAGFILHNFWYLNTLLQNLFYPYLC